MIRRLTVLAMIVGAAFATSNAALASGMADGVFLDYSWLKHHARLIDTTISNNVYAIVPSQQDVDDHTGLIIEAPVNPKEGDTMYLAYEQADCAQTQLITLSGKFSYLDGKAATEWTNQKHALQKAQWRGLSGDVYSDSQITKRVDFLCGRKNEAPDSKTVFQKAQQAQPPPEKEAR